METVIAAMQEDETSHSPIQYSQLINPEDYNRTITHEHLYIANSDKRIKQIIEEKIKNTLQPEIIEIGCGPGRLLPLMSKIKNIKLTVLDRDPIFIQYAKELAIGLSIKIMNADIRAYQHNKPVFIFYSQGFHHHLEKGFATQEYLTNVYNQLEPGGYYIVSDEFIPNYHTPREREINLTLWYSHVIHHALKHGYMQLAQEEAKIFLDDIQEGRETKKIKSTEQIKAILANVKNIDAYATSGELSKAKALALDLLTQLDANYRDVTFNNDTLKLSRGDYKISDQEFRNEVKQTGFEVESVESFGPIATIGGMSVYTLRKPA
jgi:SAM-dependent methyltransferase